MKYTTIVKMGLAILWLGFNAPVTCAQAFDQRLPAWQEGKLDIHHISTGMGNATFMILPDGTTFLVDAGALDPTEARTQSARNTKAIWGHRLRFPGSRSREIICWPALRR